LSFESGSKPTRIRSDALLGCSSLQSICLHASVDYLEKYSLFHCESLSSLAFESASKLTRIETEAGSDCTSLELICLPASLRNIDGLALTDTTISRITVEEGNGIFFVSDNFLLDFEGITVIRYIRFCFKCYIELSNGHSEKF
jgi:hypothetical protein